MFLENGGFWFGGKFKLGKFFELWLHTFLLENLEHLSALFSLKIDELSDKLLAAAAADTDGQTKCT